MQLVCGCVMPINIFPVPLRKFEIMRKLLFLFAVILSAVALPKTASAGTLTVCQGEYALCAASTCTATGGTITVNNGTSYPEVRCTCPILRGRAIADLTAGNMQGSCKKSASGHVWSLFAPRVNYPQQASGFSKNPNYTRAVIQACSADLNQGARASNCFSFDCVRKSRDLAVCKCPMGQVPANTAFLTEAGQGDPKACYKHPVSLPIINE